MGDKELHKNVGEINGTVKIMRQIQIEQSKDIKILVRDKNNQNVKIAAASSIMGAISGFVASLFRHVQ